MEVEKRIERIEDEKPVCIDGDDNRPALDREPVTVEDKLKDRMIKFDEHKDPEPEPKLEPTKVEYGKKIDKWNNIDKKIRNKVIISYLLYFILGLFLGVVVSLYGFTEHINTTTEAYNECIETVRNLTKIVPYYLGGN